MCIYCLGWLCFNLPMYKPVDLALFSFVSKALSHMTLVSQKVVVKSSI